MTYPRAVTAVLLDDDGSVVAGNPLAAAFDISFYDELNGPGRGQVSLPLSDAGSAQLRPGRYVDCQVGGISRFTFKIEGNPDYRVIERGEEYMQVVTVSGRGWACVLDEAIVYPEYARDFVIDTSWRLFSFASPSFPNTGSWEAAHEVHEYLEGVDTYMCYGHFQNAPDGQAYPAPIGFPWTTNPFNLNAGVPTGNYVDTYWIRPNPTLMPDWLSTGYYFFRTEFELIDDITPVMFTVTGDNFFTFFLQGVPILGEEINTADHWMWQGWKEHQMFLPAGTYTVAAAVYNISFDDLGATSPVTRLPCALEGYPGGSTYGNPGGLLVAIFKPGDPVTAPEYILTSDASWISWYDQEFWPGWTPGQILLQIIGEATSRGALTIVSSVTFDDDEDSNGDPWRPVTTSVDRPDIPTFAVEVGSTVMDALAQLNEMGWVDWHVQSGTWVLDVWRGRRPSSPSASATLAYGVNIGAYERNATAPYANALMVQWEGGYEIVEDGDAIDAYGTRVEDVYSSDAASAGEAALQGENELLRRAQQAYPSIVVVVEPTSSADCPYEGYGLRDYLDTPDGVVRVLSIQCQQDDDGWAVWTLELNARLDVPERRRDQLLRQIGGRNQVLRGAVN
jgi:hypothetical protein